MMFTVANEVKEEASLCCLAAGLPPQTSVWGKSSSHRTAHWLHSRSGTPYSILSQFP